MDPKRLRRERDYLRRTFSRHEPNIALSVDIAFLKEKMERIFTIDRAIQEHMLGEETFDEITYENECNECDSYKRKWLTILAKQNQMGLKDELCTDGKKSHKLNLPKLEIRKFDDNPKTWLSFWGQYKKIHEDESMDVETKFQYLAQSMTPESKAKCLVESYPPTEENYAKLIHTLKERYAKEDMLIQVYVRELLKLVNNNKTKVLGDLFDKITTNLQILESLGIGRDKYECILLPLVETALPENTLLSWNKVLSAQGSAKLSELLKFLQIEVDAERRAEMTRKYCIDDPDKQEAIPTAACLVSESKQVPSNKTIAQQSKVGNKERKVRVLLDSGSQRSYIRTALAEELNLKGLPTGETPELDKIDENNLQLRYKYLQQLRQDFRSEYLALLISKGKEGKNEPVGIIKEVLSWIPVS